MLPKDAAFKCRGVKGCVDFKALCLISTCTPTGLCFSEWRSLQLELEEAEWCGDGGGGGGEGVKAYGACE